MHRKSVVGSFACLAIVVLSPTFCSAAETLIAGTGGSPPSTQSSFAILSPDGHQNAESFTVPAGTSYTLTHLQLAAYHYPTINGTTALFTISSNVFGAPGVPLTSFNASISESFTEATAGLTLAPSNTLILQGGQKYWITGQTTSDQVNWVHGLNAFGETGFFAGGFWQIGQGGNVPAFAVLGVAVPEPSTLMLVAFAVGTMCLRRSSSLNR
jgi:hypothetical protein